MPIYAKDEIDEQTASDAVKSQQMSESIEPTIYNLHDVTYSVTSTLAHLGSPFYKPNLHAASEGIDVIGLNTAGSNQLQIGGG